jgi:hypothetical protein
MPFVAGREINTSICTGCFVTVKPQPLQTLEQAEFEHVCGSRPSLKPAPQKLPPGVATKPAPILLKGSWRSPAMPDWEACTFRLIRAENEQAKTDEPARVKPVEERGERKKLFP